MSYADFVGSKSHVSTVDSIPADDLPSWLYPFQRSLVRWALDRGRAAIFADCGLGKTPMQLAWANRVAAHTGGRVLILAPLAVTSQTISEGEKFGIEVEKSRDGKHESQIVVTNYEQVGKFDAGDFVATVCDESSALKHFDSKRQKVVTEFMKKQRYRLLCTATAAPNDFIELGTSAEALGQMGRQDMLGTFFVNDENSIRPIWWGARWRLKGHAEAVFWRWVVSWSRAARKPSDVGDFDDGMFALPKLRTHEHVVECARPLDGKLFVMPANTLDEQRQERRQTLRERCEKAASLLAGTEQGVAWCQLNDESDFLESEISGAVAVSGSDSDSAKEEKLEAFSSGDIRVLVTKPKIGGFGLNWQHCRRMTFFPSHSFEQYYQAVRRCWRYGQKHAVDVHVVTTEGEQGVLKNLQRKAEQADHMFEVLVREMGNAIQLQRSAASEAEAVEIPSWLN